MNNARSTKNIGATAFVKLTLSFFALATVLSGCATNPVTGKSEISLVSESWELKTGAQNYLPARQSQGGDYVADPGVQAYVQEVGKKLAAVSDRALLQVAVLATGIATHDSNYGQVAAIGAGASAALINSRYGRDDERESDIYGMN